MPDPRREILDRVRDALRERTPLSHPGPSPLRAPPDHAPGTGGGRAEADPDAGPADWAASFARAFVASGGEVVRFGSPDEAAGWMRGFESGFDSVAESPLVPDPLRSRLPAAVPGDAALGVSLAVGAAADTGSLLLTSGEGRSLQLLPPTLLVWLPVGSITAHLEELLALRRGEIPAAMALHSGPSKSADIGRILVTGVHGPGRIVAAVLPI